MHNLRRLCSQNLCKIGKSLAENFENFGAESQEAYSLTKKFKDIKTVVGSGGFHHLRTAINVLGSVQSSV
jgi:hypothetical protein